MAIICKLDGISNEVRHDLAYPARITNEILWKIGWVIYDQFEVFLLRLQVQERHDVINGRF